MRGIDPEISTEIEIARKAGVDMRRYYRTGMQTYMFILNHLHGTNGNTGLILRNDYSEK